MFDNVKENPYICIVIKKNKIIVLEKGVKIYNNILKRCVDYVNAGWKKSYKVEDVVGVELDNTFLFVHFNKTDYTKDAYPIGIEITFKQ